MLHRPVGGGGNGVPPHVVTLSPSGCRDGVAESYPAVPESVPVARQAVVKLAADIGANDLEVDAIRLATSEALTNALLHAYDGPPGIIHVSAALASGQQ